MTSRWASVFGLVSFLLGISGASAQDLYTQTVLADEPIALYSFVSGPGATTVIDITGNGHDSKSMMGNVEIVSGDLVGDAALFSLDPNSNMGGSIVLNLQMDPKDPEGDGIGVGSGDFSLEALVSPHETNRGAQVFISQKDGNGLGRSNALVTANEFWGSFIGGSTSDSATVPEEDIWYHYVLTFDGDGGSDAMRFYIDGELSGDAVGLRPADGLPESADGDWVIGSHKNEGAQFFIGLMDEVAFYDYRIDDPNGDNDISDSIVPRHYDALFPDNTLPCDFDADGDCDIVDLDELQYVGLGGTDSKYDLDNSGGIIDSGDTFAWLESNGTVPGDADLDGDVDANDLNAVGISWQSNNVASWAGGDFDGNGMVDAGDLNLLGLNWQFGIAAAANAAVPEPATGWLFGLGVMSTLLLRRKR